MNKIYLVSVDPCADYGCDIKQAFLDKDKAELYIQSLLATGKLSYGQINLDVLEPYDDYVNDDCKKYIYHAEYWRSEDEVTIRSSIHEMPANLDDPIDIDYTYINPNNKLYTEYTHKYPQFTVVQIVSAEKLSYNQIDKITRERMANSETIYE